MLPKEIDSGDGRRFSLRETTPADMLDLIEIAGEAASSTAWLRYALMICSVSAVDGVPILMPISKNALRDLGRRIGNAGMEALAALHYPQGEEGQTEPDAESDVAKN